MSRLPIEVKEKAIRLRKGGYSIGEVSKKLGISKGTSSIWLGKIVLNKKAQKRLTERRLIGYYNAAVGWRKKKEKEKEANNHIASDVFSKINKDKDHLKIYCSLLYWCEGSKCERTSVRFTNSDPAMIETFMSLFRKAFPIEEYKFRALVHIHEYHNDQKIKSFWSKITGIPLNQFQKSYLKANTGKRIRDNYKGCISINYYDIKIVKEIKAIFDVFSKKMGVYFNW